MNWEHVDDIDRRPRLAGAKMTMRMSGGTWTRYYLGKVFSEQIRRHWLSMKKGSS